MDWDNLRIFLAVARAGQFSSASAALQMDGATVGRRIAALEKSLKTRLFDRQPTGSRLTTAGEELLRSAEEIESGVIRAQRDLSKSSGDISGTVRIAAPDAFASLFLCPRLGELKASYPSLTIQIVPMSRSFSLSKREADIAITLEQPETGRAVVRKLVDYSLHFYAARGYLENHPSPDRIEDLSRHTLVTYVHDLLFADQLNFVPEHYSADYSRFECASAIGQIAAVRAKAGIGVLHDYAVQESDGLERVLPDVTFKRSYWMVTHFDLAGLSRVQVVTNFIVAEIKARSLSFLGDR